MDNDILPFWQCWLSYYLSLKSIRRLFYTIVSIFLFQAAINEKCLELGKKKSKTTKLDLDDKPVKKSKSGMLFLNMFMTSC